MAPNTPHSQYDDMKDVWQTCRDASQGQRAVHKAGETYLPRLSGQTDAEYKAYKARAQYFNATGRTVEGMAGLVFRKQPKIELPKSFEDWKKDINLSGKSLEGFAREAVDEVIKVGRAGVLAEYPQASDMPKGEALTVEQARRQGLRPYLALYRAENILNWKMGRVNNATVLIQLFLMEKYEDEKGVELDQIRELYITDRYRQRIWRESKTKGKKEWVVHQDIVPSKNGAAILQIPFFFLGAREGSEAVQDPPIESLAYVNLGHYRNSADLENGAHVAGLPTPWINGITDPDKSGKLHLGSSTVLMLPPESTAGFLQCGNDGFATIEKAMDRKEQQMAALGARMLAPEKRDAEAEGTHEIKRGGENSVLATLAGSVESKLTQALAFIVDWSGLKGEEAKIELNKDYLPSPMDATMLTEWVKTWQARGISYETFFQGLQRGELVPENTTPEDERERIDNDPPSLGTMGGGDEETIS